VHLVAQVVAAATSFRGYDPDVIQVSVAVEVKTPHPFGDISFDYSVRNLRVLLDSPRRVALRSRNSSPCPVAYWGRRGAVDTGDVAPPLPSSFSIVQARPPRKT
jgi:hypothetical protein